MNIPKQYKIEKSASTDAHRPQLSNVLIERDKDGNGIAIATDGRQLARVPVMLEEGDEPGLLSPEALVAARSAKNGGAGLISLGKTELALLDKRSFPRPTIEEFGDYPNWKQVVPDHKATPVKFKIALDPARLLSLAESIGWHKNGGATGVILEFIDESSPITVRLSADANGELGVLMPLRISA